MWGRALHRHYVDMAARLRILLVSDLLVQQEAFRVVRFAQQGLAVGGDAPVGFLVVGRRVEIRVVGERVL